MQNKVNFTPTTPLASAQTNALTTSKTLHENTTFVMNEDFGLRIPLATPPKTKAQLKVELAEFGARYEHFMGDYTADIEVWNHQDIAKALLNCIAPRGSDPIDAAMICIIGNTNDYIEMDQNE